MSIESITIEPPLSRWRAMAETRPQGDLLGRSVSQWRELTRRELALPVDRTIIASGHQPTLWHPGILAKYIAVDAMVRSSPDHFCGLNVIVDQDVENPAAFDVPIRRNDSSLYSLRIDLAPASSVGEIPVGWRKPFEPRDVTIEPLDVLPELGLRGAWIRAALADFSGHPSAAAQTAHALSVLMSVCAAVDAMSTIKASDLMRTTLARAMLAHMADDPQRCARLYNQAIAAQPEARMMPLAIHDDYVELPLWRLRPDATRARAYDADVEQAITVAGLPEGANRGGLMADVADPAAVVVLLPRALLMTAIIRLALADVFVHGRGGAIYDHAMEQWIRNWLGVDVSPMAAVSATLRLPLMRDGELTLVRSGGLAAARARQRRLEHDPESGEAAAVGATGQPGWKKQAMLREIDRLPRRSPERRSAFLKMHQELREFRRSQASVISQAQLEVERLQRLTADAMVAQRRDWAFPLYPQTLLLELVKQVRMRCG